MGWWNDAYAMGNDEDAGHSETEISVKHNSRISKLDLLVWGTVGVFGLYAVSSLLHGIAAIKSAGAPRVYVGTEEEEE